MEKEKMTDWFFQDMTLEQADALFENNFEVTVHNGVVIVTEQE